ncbi:hypothetical protein TYRP_013278 [Tyrophagus putrescentiae]|nr:hypothetical protein TYRP_013278 [Tyrophagus putrescentiae]
MTVLRRMRTRRSFYLVANHAGALAHLSLHLILDDLRLGLWLTLLVRAQRLQVLLLVDVPVAVQVKDVRHALHFQAVRAEAGVQYAVDELRLGDAPIAVLVQPLVEVHQLGLLVLHVEEVAAAPVVKVKVAHLLNLAVVVDAVFEALHPLHGQFPDHLPLLQQLLRLRDCAARQPPGPSWHRKLIDGLTALETLFVNQSLVVVNQLLQGDDIVGQRHRLLLHQVGLSLGEPAQKVTEQIGGVLQRLEVVVEALRSLVRPALHLVPSRLDDGDPVLDHWGGVRVALAENAPGQVERAVLAQLLLLHLPQEGLVFGQMGPGGRLVLGQWSGKAELQLRIGEPLEQGVHRLVQPLRLLQGVRQADLLLRGHALNLRPLLLQRVHLRLDLSGVLRCSRADQVGRRAPHKVQVRLARVKVLHKVLMSLNEAVHRVQVAVYGLVKGKQLPGFLQPLNQRLDGVLELPGEEQRLLQLALLVHRLLADGIPLVLQLVKHLLEDRNILAGALLLEALAEAHRRVVGGLLCAQLPLELLIGVVAQLLDAVQRPFGIVQPADQVGPGVVELLRLLEAVVEGARPLRSLCQHPLPAMLHTGQKVLDQRHVLLLTEVLQVSALLVQIEHRLAVVANVLLEVFVLLNLLEDAVQHSANWLQVAEVLLCARQPINKGLERLVELRRLLEGNLQLDLAVIGSAENVLPLGLEDLEVVREVNGGALLGLADVLLAVLQQGLHLVAGHVQLVPAEHVLDLLRQTLRFAQALLQLLISPVGLVQEGGPAFVEVVQSATGVASALRAARLRLNQLLADGLHLDDLRVAVDGLRIIERTLDLGDPRQQLIERLLELPQLEEGVLEGALAVADRLQQVLPAAVDVGDGVANASRLTRRHPVQKLMGHSIERLHLDHRLQLAHLPLHRLNVRRYRSQPGQALFSLVEEIEQALHLLVEIHRLLHRINQVLLSASIESRHIVPGTVQVLEVLAHLRSVRLTDDLHQTGTGSLHLLHLGLGALHVVANLRQRLLLLLNLRRLHGGRLLRIERLLQLLDGAHHIGEPRRGLAPSLAGQSLALIPEVIQTVQFVSNVPDGGLIRFARLADHLLRLRLHRIEGALPLGQVVSDGIVVGNLLLDLWHVRGDGLRILQLVVRVVQCIEHAVQFVAELGGGLKRRLQVVLVLAEQAAKAVVPLIVAVDDLLNGTGVGLSGKQGNQLGSGLVQPLHQRLVRGERLNEPFSGLLLLANLLGVDGGRGQALHLRLHLVEEGGDLLVRGKEVLHQGQGVLDGGQAVLGELRHAPGELLQLIGLAVDGSQVVIDLSGRFAHQPLHIGHHLTDSSSLAVDVVVQRLGLPQQHQQLLVVGHNRLRFHQLSFSILEPVQQLVHFVAEGSVLLQRQSELLRPSRQLLDNGVKAADRLADQAVDGGGVLAALTGAGKLRPHAGDRLEKAALCGHLPLQTGDDAILLVKAEAVHRGQALLRLIHPPVQLVVGRGKRSSCRLQAVIGSLSKVIVATLNRLRLCPNEHRIVGASKAVKQLLAVGDKLADGRLLLVHIADNVRQFFTLGSQLVGTDAERLESGQAGVSVGQPGGVRQQAAQRQAVLHQLRVLVGDGGQSSGHLLTFLLVGHQANQPLGDGSQVGKVPPVVDHLAVEGLVFADPSAKLFLFHAERLQGGEATGCLLEPLLQGNDAFGKLLRHRQTGLQHLHALISVGHQRPETAVNVGQLLLNLRPLAALQVGHKLLAQRLKGLDTLRSVSEHLHQVPLLLQLRLQCDVVGTGRLLPSHHLLRLRQPLLHAAEGVLKAARLEERLVEAALPFAKSVLQLVPLVAVAAQFGLQFGGANAVRRRLDQLIAGLADGGDA